MRLERCWCNNHDIEQSGLRTGSRAASQAGQAAGQAGDAFPPRCRRLRHGSPEPGAGGRDTSLGLLGTEQPCTRSDPYTLSNPTQKIL